MKLFKMQTKGGAFNSFLVILFILVAVATFGYLQKTGRLTELKVNMFSSISTDEIVFGQNIKETEEEQGLSIGVTKEDIQQEETEEKHEPAMVFPSQGKTYEETAGEGEGITNLVRRAIKRYSEENNIEITSEQKVFVEDHIQNHIGDRVLQINETITNSEDLIAEGMSKSQELTDSELEHLENFSELVWTSGFGTPRGL